MIKVKNVRPGILILADIGLKLAPGETADVEKISVQMQRCLDDGLLARIDIEPETKPKSKSSSRSAADKTETREQPQKGGNGKKSAAVEPKTEPSGDPVTTNGVRPQTPGVSDDNK
ncbi:MAG: hypothetical protein ACYC64_10420 [Armatimonadota bacterium]